ncbi:MAG: hypothetical protein ABEI53_01515, partial [Candidatus Magasanikbacteria bacterium]
TDKDIEGIDGFKKELKRINNVYDQYKDSLEAYKHWRQEVKLKNLGCKSNEDRLDYLDQLRGFLLEEVSDELDVDEDAAEAIFQPEDPSVFSEIKDFTPQSGDLEEFIHAHRGGIGESYEKKYDLDSQKTITDEMVSEINSKFLEEASELLEDVLDGSAGYDIDETIDGYQEKVVPMVEKKKELGEEIENHFEKGERGKAENKIEQKKRLEQDIRAQKKELASDFVHENMDGTQRDSSENYKRVLKQLSQRYLGGKARKKAEELSKDIVVNE